MKEKDRIRVEIRSRGKYAQVYSGNNMKTAIGIKNMLKRQDPRLHILMVREV